MTKEEKIKLIKKYLKDERPKVWIGKKLGISKQMVGYYIRKYINK